MYTKLAHYTPDSYDIVHTDECSDTELTKLQYICKLWITYQEENAHEKSIHHLSAISTKNMGRFLRLARIIQRPLRELRSQIFIFKIISAFLASHLSHQLNVFTRISTCLATPILFSSLPPFCKSYIAILRFSFGFGIKLALQPGKPRTVAAGAGPHQPSSQT